MSNLEKFKKAILRLKQEKEYTADAQIHAPKGGVTVKGKFFPGGQFIPNEGGYAEAYKKELEKEKPQKIEKVFERSDAGKGHRAVSIERIKHIKKQFVARSPEQNKDDVVTKLEKKTGLSYDRINLYIAYWAQTSADENPKSLGVQFVAKDIFKAGKTSHLNEKIAHKNDERKIFIKAIYDETQQWFKEQGFEPDDEITLYRGVRDKIVDGKYSLQPLSSFSFLKKVAQKFAEEGINNGTTFVTKIPVKHIFSTPLTGIGCANEYEIVVVGHDININVINNITIRKNSDFKKINKFDNVLIFPGLESLKGAPKIVGGDFDCTYNDNLKSLEGAPKEVGGNFYCFNNNLKSLEGCPEIVGGNFDCSFNKKLELLDGCPEIVGGDFYCTYNNNLKSLDGCPKIVGGDFDCTYNDNLKSLEGAPEIVGGDFYYSNPFTEEDVRKVCNVKGRVIKR